MRWVDCRLFVLLSCCPYCGLVKAFLIATHQRVKEEGWQSGRKKNEHRASVDFALEASCVYHSLAACCTALQRLAQLGRVAQLCGVYHSLPARCSTAWPCCTALPCAAHLGRVPRVAQLCSVQHTLAECHVLHSFAACSTPWPRVHSEFRIGRVLHSFAACSTPWPCVHSEFRIGRVLHSFAACSTTPWPSVHSKFRICRV
jgi:hypothetical protein